MTSSGGEVRLDTFTDEELAVLCGPGGIVVAPYLGAVDAPERVATPQILWGDGSRRGRCANTGWNTGNLIYDHRDAIGGFVSSAAQWTGGAASTVADVSTEAVADATDWASDRAGDLADAGCWTFPDRAG